MADLKDIARMTMELSASYPNWNVTALTNEVYYQDLKDIPADELLLAARHCRSEAGRKFAPSVGEIRGAVMELRRASMNIPSAYDAWQEVLRVISDVGSYGSPEWSSPLIEKVVNSLGWRNLCMSENQVSDRARFLEAYEQLSNRAEKETMLIPEVRAYLEDHGAKLLDAPAQIKQLTKGMEK